MNFKNLLITSVCAVCLCGGLQAQRTCNSSMLSGPYGLSIQGWATVSPTGAVLPFVALGAITFNNATSGSDVPGSAPYK